MEKKGYFLLDIPWYLQVRVYTLLAFPFIFVIMAFIAIIFPNFMNISRFVATIGLIVSLIGAITIIVIIKHQIKINQYIEEERKKLDQDFKIFY